MTPAAFPDPAPLPRLTDGPLTLRPLEPADVDAIVAVLAEPEVARWWGTDNDAERVLAERDVSLTIEVDRTVAGLLLVHEETDPMYRSVALDIALGSAARGRGLGSGAIRLVARHLIALGHHRFVIDPALDNVAAIRCYRAVGFREVGILRRAEKAPDGRWRDGLLMDLLADELR